MLDDNGTAIEFLRDAVTENRELRYEEIHFLRSKLGWSDVDISTERRNMFHVLRNERIAGTSDDRSKQQSEADKAAQLNASEGSKLDAKIQELTAKRNQLERDARLASQRLDDMNAAVAELRKLAPKYRVQEYNERRAMIGNDIGAKCLAMEGEVRHLEQLVHLDINTFGAMEHIAIYHADCITVDPLHRTRRIDGGAWMERVSELQRELSTLKPEAAKLRAEYDKALQEIDSILDYWIE
ncbi:MAG: hypothetical protein WCI02_19215, partial [Planctomycetota bacterium]